MDRGSSALNEHVEVAGAIAAEITARLEDLAAASVDLHSGMFDASKVKRTLLETLTLLDAYVVLSASSSPSTGNQRFDTP